MFYDPKLIEKIKARIDHVIGLSTIHELYKNKQDINIMSPMTRSSITSVLAFGNDPSHRRATNHALADIFFGNKLVCYSEMWLILLYSVIKQIPYLTDNVSFISNFENHLLYRIRNSITNITLSGLGSIFPLMKCPMDVAIWYNITSPYILETMNMDNDKFNRLRYFSTSAVHLIRILDLLKYPYPKNVSKLIKMYR